MIKESSVLDCIFCRANGLLKGEVLAQTANAYLIEANYSGRYLIIPQNHAQSLHDLPGTWWVEVKKLLGKVPHLPSSYNLSLNYGKEAGQTQEHLHFWIIPRHSKQRSSGKGLARLIDEVNKTSD